MDKAEKPAKAPETLTEAKTPGPVPTGGYKALGPSTRVLETWRRNASK